MVVFTCNKCGESLKKKDVEKHCFTRCRGPPYLTCVDCLKDFCDDFVKHTMCISEDDRYSAMGLKGTHSKQKSKQQIWVETVHNSVGQAIDDDIPGLTASIRSLMLYLQEQPNLPDKAKAFFNFVKNARRAEPPANIEFVWNILEKARNDLQAKQKAEREAAEAEKRKAKESQMQQKMEESSDSSSEDSDSDQSAGDKNGDKNGAGAKTSGTKKESKTEMHRKDVVNGTEDKKKKRMMSESESVITVSSEFRKTKKKKRNPESESQDVGNTTNLNSAMDACHLNTFSSADMDQKMTKKEKKEKKKRGKYEAELKEIESAETADQSSNVEDQQNVNDEETDVKKGKKKKDKKKKSVEENGDVIAQDLTENNKEKKKVSKKKAKGKNGEVEEFQEYNVGQRNSKEKYEKSGNGKLNETLDLEQQEKVKFSMDTAILQVLESVDEISLKRLSKKVICEYLNSLDDDAHVDEAKIMTKFQKRLDKMHNVVVHKDKVKLRTSRD